MTSLRPVVALLTAVLLSFAARSSATEEAFFQTDPKCCGIGLNLTGEWVYWTVDYNTSTFFNISMPVTNNHQYRERPSRVYVESCGGDFALFQHERFPVDHSVARSSLADPPDVVLKSITWDKLYALNSYFEVQHAGNSSTTFFRIRFTFVDEDHSIGFSPDYDRTISLAQSTTDGSVTLSFLAPDIDLSNTTSGNVLQGSSSVGNLTFLAWYYTDTPNYDAVNYTMMTECGIARLALDKPGMALLGGMVKSSEAWDGNMSNPIAIGLPPFSGEQMPQFEVLVYNFANYSVGYAGLKANLTFIDNSKATPNYTLIYGVSAVAGVFASIFLYMIIIRPILIKRKRKKLQQHKGADESDSASPDESEHDEEEPLRPDGERPRKPTAKRDRTKKAAELRQTKPPEGSVSIKNVAGRTTSTKMSGSSKNMAYRF